MKELFGGAIIAALLAASLGLWMGTIILSIVAILAFFAGLKDEEIRERRGENWRKDYPSYRY